MPDLADLPIELVDHILTLAFGIVHQDEWGYHSFETLHAKSLSSLVLVSRKWHSAFIRRLYSQWTYDGARHSYAALWMFLRAVLTNLDLAATVRVLNIGNWSSSEVGDQPLELSPSDTELIRNVIRRARIGELESEILGGLLSAKCDRRPLVALLLASLQNISTLYAHVPASDPFLKAVLSAGLKQQLSPGPSATLSRLEELYLLSEVPGFVEDQPGPSQQDIEEPPLKLHDVWPVLYLQNLRSVRLYNLDTEGVASLLQEHQNRSDMKCHIQHLHIATKQTSTCAPTDVTALLTFPETLTSLSFSWSGKGIESDSVKGKTDDIQKISNAEVYGAIQKYQDTLEYLDISHDSHDLPRESVPGQVNLFDPLKQFTKVKYLSASVGVLIGEDSPSRRRESLPPNIESLVLCIDEAAQTTPGVLSSQLQEVVSSAQFPHLKCLRIGDGSVKSDHPPEYQALQQSCAQSGIHLAIQPICTPTSNIPNCPFPAGGRCPQPWRKTYQLRTEGTIRYTRQKHQAHMDRLRRGPPPRSRICPTTAVPFFDHTRNRSYMVFENLRYCMLPSLVHFAIYFTHPESNTQSPEEVKAELVALYNTIRNVLSDFHFRLDIYFLPDADETACMAHYRAEKAVRGNSMTIIEQTEERIEKELPPPRRNPTQLPGMIDVFKNGAKVGGLLVICPTRSWRDGEQRMCSVRFDPQKKYDNKEPVWKEWRGITTEIVQRNNGNEHPLANWMWDHAHYFREEAQQCWYRAVEAGWWGNW